jgi:hypothetical protein
MDDALLKSLGEEAVGVVSGSSYSAGLDTPANKRFVAAFERKAGRLAPMAVIALGKHGARELGAVELAAVLVSQSAGELGDLPGRDLLQAARSAFAQPHLRRTDHAHDAVTSAALVLLVGHLDPRAVDHAPQQADQAALDRRSQFRPLTASQVLAKGPLGKHRAPRRR